MRHRQQLPSPVQDDDALAALDLGVAFGSIENTTNCAGMALFHTFENNELLERVRQEVFSSISRQPLVIIDTEHLVASPLLSAIYAETLRLYVSTYTFINSPHADRKWRLPKGTTNLVNSELSHMNSDFWNTKNGAHPLQTFWPDRFLIDPADPSTGLTKSLNLNINGRKDDKPYFSLDGLEAAWIPYGGGRIVCSGRFMAKNAIIMVCAFDSRL
ncbi:cytochrome P450 [Hypoxylon rubiginosum]|uniref:Cytochrome P450 n=1 Tax=Hypoxylon rubiginosum TaxID=110542 RepID=A0ACC0CL98_9PEZI|nr:cytochrome P450 [Hypoxylon rubiginosum]